jgi:hypothetical protein
MVGLTACVFRHTSIIEELGNGYYYMGDGNESQILYNEKGKTDSGLIVTGPEIVEYNFNKDFIIAKSTTIIGDSTKFWIIDKKLKSHKFDPMDSLQFYRELDRLDIDLKLRERK